MYALRKPRGGSKAWPDNRTVFMLVLMMKNVVETLTALKALSVSAAILDSSGTIIAVNDAWREFGRRNGLRLADSGIGSNYIKFCAPEGARPSRFASDLKELLAGRLDLLTQVYPCHSRSRKRWFSLIALPLSLDRPSGVALLHINLTDTLPLPIVARSTRVKSDGGRQIRTSADLGTISGAIEHSVLETLSSQLSAMLTDTHRALVREGTTLPDDSERILASAQLSKRQMQILRLLGEGKTNKEIAEALFRSPNTVKLHVSAILQRLKLKSRTQAALLASKLYKDGTINLAGGDVKSWKKARTAAA